MLLQDSRRSARTDAAGELVPLEEQDRSLWDGRAIAEGLMLVEAALREGKPGPYGLQAAIAALHAQAECPKETDWRQIAVLYEELYRLFPSPIVRLNQAVAIAMSEGIERGLARLDEIQSSGELDGYYLLPMVRADLLRRLGRARDSRRVSLGTAPGLERGRARLSGTASTSSRSLG
jgi:RNA polymerase sigma-70 factor (ECF subfamily)